MNLSSVSLHDRLARVAATVAVACGSRGEKGSRKARKATLGAVGCHLLLTPHCQYYALQGIVRAFPHRSSDGVCVFHCLHHPSSRDINQYGKRPRGLAKPPLPLPRTPSTERLRQEGIMHAIVLIADFSANTSSMVCIPLLTGTLSLKLRFDAA